MRFSSVPILNTDKKYMKSTKSILVLTAMLSLTFLLSSSNALKNEESIHLSPVTSEDNSTEEAFNTMMQVIAHKRCVNCHPSGDRPRQGEDSHLHKFNVQRGSSGHGLPANQCGTCHQPENNDFSGVPGAPHWHLAPRSMGWEGLSRTEIAAAMLDRSKNGNRSVTEIEKHLTEDPLVLWVFEPGVTNTGEPREKPPVTKEAYIQAVKTWVAGGAIIPNQ